MNASDVAPVKSSAAPSREREREGIGAMVQNLQPQWAADFMRSTRYIRRPRPEEGGARQGGAARSWRLMSHSSSKKLSTHQQQQHQLQHIAAARRWARISSISSNRSCSKNSNSSSNTNNNNDDDNNNRWQHASAATAAAAHSSSKQQQQQHQQRKSRQAWAAACAQKYDFYNRISEGTLGSFPRWLRGRFWDVFDSRCYGVWEWRRVGGEDVFGTFSTRAAMGFGSGEG